MPGRAWVAIAAGVPALLYLPFAFHYSVNVPWGFDDWAIVPLVNSAIHGHLSMGTLWPQYGDRRLVISRLITVAFGVFDGLNERPLVMFTAALFVVSYVAFLVLFRGYLGRRLTCSGVLVVGVVWFSLSDWFAAVWSFKLLCWPWSSSSSWLWWLCSRGRDQSSSPSQSRQGSSRCCRTFRDSSYGPSG